MPDDQEKTPDPQFNPDEDWTLYEDEIAELFPPDPAYLRKRLAVEAMHEAGQFIDPDDFDID